MKYRRLGRTGLSVSEVGFGGAGIGHVWGATTDADCERAIRRALDLGITFFDTSPMYGRGRSEENLGRGLKGARDQVVLATKVRLHSEDELADMGSAIRRSVEQSLARLNTDWIDVLQIHHQVGASRGRYLAVADPPIHALLLSVGDALAFAEAAAPLITEGKVRFLGITAWDGDRDAVRMLLQSGAFGTAQILYNLVNQTAASPPPAGFDDVDQGASLPVAADNDIGVIAIRSHAAGALADTLDREVKPDSDVARDHARAQKLRFLVDTPFSTLSAVALRFCLDHPAIHTVVPGFKNAAEVEEAAACTDLPPLPAEGVADLDRLYVSGFSASPERG